MQQARVDNAFWRGRRVLLTGHTGFKGGWLTLWLSSMGAKVHGFSLPAPTDPSFFSEARLSDVLAGHVIGDVRNFAEIAQAMTAASPEIVLHLAAQPLVRRSYEDPVETYSTNVMGTVSILEAVRRCPSVRAVVNVTTDKCYENKEWLWGYRESEAMGGRDPYSSSKGCAELVSGAYRASFLQKEKICLATARAGNVIGGGDWAQDRLIPDFFRAALANQPIKIRYPEAIRPWQHVLEPLSGYLLLAEQLSQAGAAMAEAWNFGPGDDDARPVRWLLDRMSALMPGTGWTQPVNEHPHEAGLLKLDSSKARGRLHWRPMWHLEEALSKTVEWHLAWQSGADMQAVSLGQILAHQNSVGA